MNKNFLHKKENLIKIKKNRFIVGILIGLGYAISFYSILYLIRESFRILPAALSYDIWVLSDTDVNFYNIFFAFISVIFGQSVCFTYWFNNPKKLFGRYYLRQISIVNDQRVFTWYFLSWFSKLAVVFGIMFGTSLHGAHYVFSFYPKYNYVFILIIIVLFFSTWNNIRLTFKKQSLKWLMTSIIIVTALSLGLSRVNVIDYKAINKLYLQNSIYYNHILELPESDSYSRLEKRSLVEDIYIVYPKYDQHAKSEPIIVIDNKKVQIEELNRKINELQQLRYESDRYYTLFNLHVHKGINMNFINKVKQEISKANVFRIAYAVVPINSKYDQRYYKEKVVYTRIPKYKSDSILYRELINSIKKYSNQIEINEVNKNSCLVNDTVINYSELKETLINQIALDTNFIIIFRVNNKVEFSSYIKVITYTYEAITELIDLYSMNRFSKKYDLLKNDQRKEVRHKYPIRIFEITDELKN